MIIMERMPKFRARIKKVGNNKSESKRWEYFYLWELEDKKIRGLGEIIEFFEQYTGLKDKNGKEIYEGDILASNYSTVYKVSYSEPNGRFEMWSEDGCGGSIADDQYTEDFEIEVIGNIHENPELLGDTNATNKEEE